MESLNFSPDLIQGRLLTFFLVSASFPFSNEMNQISSEGKWTGKVRAKITGPTPDQAWAALKDFGSLHKWVPSIHACRLLEGVEGEPGCVRYCAGSLNRSYPTQPVGWSKERLTAFDPAGRSYSYQIVETNKGFGSYSATLAVVTDPGDAADRCWIEWSFVADPVQGWTRDGFVGYLEKLAEGAAVRVEEEIRSTGLASN